MSFLNPVSEPVLRFSSTDAGAPQINYNARTAGDTKAVIKGCLVTGYGAKPSAGWSIINEVDHVAEFVSPSAAMSDYRLGVNDTSASSTTWYYQYQNARVNPRSNAAPKAMSWIEKAHASNGWELLVTERGMYFIELAYNPIVNDMTARMTYWGAVKSALIENGAINIAFYNIGHDAALNEPFAFYTHNYGGDFRLGGYINDIYLIEATPLPLQGSSMSYGISSIDIISPIYLAPINKGCVLGQLSGISSMLVAQADDVYGKNVVAVDDRPALKVPIGNSTNDPVVAKARCRTMLINLDYWGY